jgi:O-antigen ligase
LWKTLALTAGAVSLGLSGSRGGVIGLAIGLMAAIVLAGLGGRVRNGLLTVIIVCAVGIVALAGSGRFGSLFDASYDTNRQRVGAFAVAIEAFRSSPIIGVGDFGRYLEDAADRAGAAPADRVTHAHNLLLEAAAEGGVVGLLTQAFLWVAAFTALLRRGYGQGLPVLVAILASNSVDYIFYTVPMYALFWLALHHVALPKEPRNGANARYLITSPPS